MTICKFFIQFVLNKVKAFVYKQVLVLYCIKKYDVDFVYKSSEITLDF